MLKQEMIEKMSNTQKDMEDMIRNNSEGHDGVVRLDNHLDRWATRKREIYKLFGNKLKIEKEVEASLTKEDINEKLSTFFSEKANDPRLLIAKMFLRMIPVLDVAKNSLSQDVSILDKKFNAGMKISRTFKQLVPKELLEKFQIDFSMLIQDLKVKGTLVLSIDPIDYLTMSENDGGWRSCHNIFDGEYKAGTLSYMMDSSTIIAYVKTSDIKRGNCVFGKKVWRQCIYLAPDFDGFIHSRSYPNSNKSNRSTATEMLKTLLANNIQKDLFNFDKEQQFQEGFMSTSTLSDEGWVEDAIDSPNHYNDILHGAIERAYVVHFVEKSKITVSIGADVPCISGSDSYVYNSECLDADCGGYDW